MMNSAPVTPREHRIIVTVDAQSNLPSTVAMAVALAQALQSTLHGLFVEDSDLLSVAGLPFSQEVTLQSGNSRALDDKQVQRSLRRSAAQFHQLLQRQADQSALICSYSRVRGRKQNLDLDESAPADLLVIGQPQRAQKAGVQTQRILLLLNPNTQLPGALEALLASRQQQRVELLLLAEPGAALQELLSRYPNVAPSTLSAQQLPAALLSPHWHSDAVIVDRQLDPLLVSEVLNLATCPVIVVS